MTTKTDTKTSSLIINELTKDQYAKALEEGQINEDELYLVTGEEYTKNEVDRLLNDKQNKLIAGSNIIIDELTNTISSTGGGDTSLCVHLEGHEIISGVKEFTGGSGGSSTDVSLKSKNAIAIGDESQTAYTGVYVHRKCASDGNKVNTAGFLVNSDGSAKFTHKKGTTTEASGTDDSYIRFDQTTLVYSTSQNITDEKDILHEGNVKTINGESIKGSGDIVIEGGDTSDCVHIAGEETITGTKIFSANPRISANTNIAGLSIQNKNISKGGSYYEQYNTIDFLAGNGITWKDRTAMFENRVNTSTSDLRLIAYNPSKTTPTEADMAELKVSMSSSGVATTKAPTPTEDTTTSTQIDTVGARNTKLATKQDLLTPGQNISIINNEISVTGDLGAKITFRDWSVD